jgi:hypothetical protein
MPERLFTGPSEFVIWTVSALLALVAGLGTAFFLWSLLRHTGEPVVAQAAIVSFGIGLALVGISTEKALVRVFCCLFAAMLVFAYLLGGPAFVRLVP